MASIKEMSTVSDNILFQADTTRKYDIPLTHLDYTYIGKCDDVKELEKIYKVLKSGDEGCYPDLEKFCEDRIEKLNPKSRVLRKDLPLGRPGDLPKDEWQNIDTDLKNWELEMKSAVTSKKTIIDEFDDPELPPIRTGFINGHTKQEKAEEVTKKNKRVTPRDYKEWDKFDIDKELNDVDKQEEKKTKYKSSKAPPIDVDINTAGMTDEEKMFRAGKEKDKGNEAFRAGDYEESIAYYTRSIKLHTTAASYNNRAIAYLKTSQWTNAAEDCNRVLKLEPENIKAMLRRGTAYKGMKEFQKSLLDYQNVLKLEPENKRAQDLIEELQVEEKKFEEEKRKRKEKGRRMVIEEVDEESEDEIVVDKNPAPVVNGHDKAEEKVKIEEIKENSEEKSNENKKARKGGKKIQIEEIDESETATDNQKNEMIEINKEKASLNENDNKTMKSEETKGKKKNQQKKIEVKSTEKHHTVSKDIWTEDDLSKKESESTNISKNTEQGSKNENENRMDFPLTSDKNKDISADKGETSDSKDKKKVEMDEKGDKEATTKKEMTNGVLERPKFVQGKLSPEVAKLREEGNTLFRTGQYGDAIHKYTKAVERLEKDKTDQRVNRSLLYSNRAACYLKTGDCPNAIKDCTTALDLVPHSIKPLLRRANAYEVLERFRLAYADYKHVLSIDSSVDMALQGSSRCQKHLTDVDGSKWREKLPRVPSVQSWEIPEIVDSSETTTTSSQPIKSSVSSPSQPITNNVSSPPSQTSQPKKIELTPAEKFDKLKTDGNSHVQKGNHSEAVQCYTQCIDLLPDRVVSYTNRSLCYLKLNKPSEAEEDCTKALSLEKDNVKALFRRAQARKMLKKNKESLEDLNHLLKVDPKNSAAKTEMEVVKGLWREELNNLKKTMEKPRKRIVIEETDSEEEDEKAPKTSSKSTKTEQSPIKQESSNKQPTKEKQSTPPSTSQQSSQSSTQPSTNKQTSPANKQESSKKKNKAQKAKQTPPEVNGKQNGETSKTDSEKLKEKQKDQKSKSAIKPTSFGLPQTVPKLEKATPYEFISAWNSLKKSKDIQPYADLLRQIAPEELPKVISNKLDGAMLSTVLKCVNEKFSSDDDLNTSYEILRNISKVPRFDTIAMFLSKAEKKDLESVLERVQSKGLTSKEELVQIRKKYSL